MDGLITMIGFVQLNPDVIIKNDTKMLLNMMDPDIDAMFNICWYGGLALQTNWLFILYQHFAVRIFFIKFIKFIKFI